MWKSASRKVTEFLLIFTYLLPFSIEKHIFFIVVVTVLSVFGYCALVEKRNHFCL